MVKLALFVRLTAQAGKEQALAEFLVRALPLAREERETIHWFAARINEHEFGIFDTFEHEHGRQAHIDGAIALALRAQAKELLSRAPSVERLDLIATK